MQNKILRVDVHNIEMPFLLIGLIKSVWLCAKTKEKILNKKKNRFSQVKQKEKKMPTIKNNYLCENCVQNEWGFFPWNHALGPIQLQAKVVCPNCTFEVR